MNTIKLTRENLHALSGSPGKCGFTRKQIELLGFTWPPQKGWLSSLIGTEISMETYEAVGKSCRKKWTTAPVEDRSFAKIAMPYRHVWLVLWADQNTQRSGVHGVFNDEDAACSEVERANCNAVGKVFRAEQWPIAS